MGLYCMGGREGGRLSIITSNAYSGGAVFRELEILGTSSSEQANKPIADTHCGSNCSNF